MSERAQSIQTYPLKVLLVGCRDDLLPELRRALANMGVDIAAELPTIGAALAALPLASTEKRLLITQPMTLDEIPAVERLNETFPGQPILALVDSSGGPVLFHQAMRAGAAQVVGLPLQIDDFKASLDRIAVQFGFASSRTQVIAVSGVTEGCGSTTVAINLAAEIASLQAGSCILMELSLSLGRLATYLDVKPQYTTFDLLSDPDRLDLQVVGKALTKVNDRFFILSGPYQAIIRPFADPRDVLRLIHYARQLASVVVLDMPYSYDSLYFGALDMAHHLVLVGQQDIASLHTLGLMQDLFEKRENSCAPHVVLNRFNPHHPQFGLDAFRKALGSSRLSTIANDYRAVVSAANIGRILRHAAPESPALADIEALGRQLLGMEQKKASRRRHYFGVSRLSRLLNMKLVLRT